MYIMGENPAMSDPDVQHAREALAKLEHLVVQDIFLTETAKYADVILPASAWPEKDGTVTNTNRQVQIGRKALPLPGEARQDLDGSSVELASRLGLDWNYQHVSEVFAEMAACMPSLANITWERLEREELGHLSVSTRPTSRATTSSSATASRPRPGAASSCRPSLSPARRGARRRIPDGAHHRPAARTLAHGLDDAPRQRARRPRAGGGRLPAPRGISNGSACAPASTMRVSTRRGAIDLKARVDAAMPRRA